MKVWALLEVLKDCDPDGDVKLSLPATLVNGDDELDGDYICGVQVEVQSSAEALNHGRSRDRVIFTIDANTSEDEYAQSGTSEALRAGS